MTLCSRRRPSRWRSIAVLLSFVIVLLFAAKAFAAPTPLRRVAIVVGANEPAPGRTALRYAHEDARRFADVLKRVGRFGANDVRVMLEPKPSDLLGELSRVAADIAAQPGTETLFVFYYSGHSDGQAVYPQGQALPIAALRERVSKLSARIRIGILDTCRGGTWTQSKGLAVGPPLDAADLIAVASEGTALVSSSSGFENAHEAEAFKGSFFTHHFTAGLLGAADKSGDGSITLHEAFEYAKERTVRDSAKLAPVPQHPSFDLQLRGRQDIVLAQIAASASALDVNQTKGPIEVIHLSSGVTIAELPSGVRTVKLALPPGRYLVRRVEDGRAFTREVEVPAGATTTIAEGQLEATGNMRLSMKGDDEEAPPIPTHTTLPRNWGEWSLAGGVATGAPSRRVTSSGEPIQQSDDGRLTRSMLLTTNLTFGFTDRFQCAFASPACAFRFGKRGGVEVVPRLGLTAIGLSSLSGIVGNVDTATAIRIWTSSQQSVIASFGASSAFATRGPEAQRADLSTWRFTSSVGYSWTLGTSLTVNLGVAGSTPIAFGNGPLSSSSISIGSVQGIGYRSLPLIRIHASRRFAIDLSAQGNINLGDGSFRDEYLVGFTYNF